LEVFKTIDLLFAGKEKHQKVREDHLQQGRQGWRESQEEPLPRQPAHGRRLVRQEELDRSRHVGGTRQSQHAVAAP